MPDYAALAAQARSLTPVSQRGTTATGEAYETEGTAAPEPSGWLPNLNRALTHAAYPQSAGDFAGLMIPAVPSAAISAVKAGGSMLKRALARRVPVEELAQTRSVRVPVMQDPVGVAPPMRDYSTDVDLMAHGGFAPERVRTPMPTAPPMSRNPSFPGARWQPSGPLNERAIHERMLEFGRGDDVAALVRQRLQSYGSK
jgi:hypothetical protein